MARLNGEQLQDLQLGSRQKIKSEEEEEEVVPKARFLVTASFSGFKINKSILFGMIRESRNN